MEQWRLKVENALNALTDGAEGEFEVLWADGQS